MKIYTKTGDRGKTGLFRGARVDKHHPRVEAYGNVDELNAVLGIALGHIQHPQIRQIIAQLQQELFALGADLATPGEDPNMRIPVTLVHQMENWIDELDAQLPPLQNFILPGGSPAGAWLHYARTVCRRAERSATRLAEQESINPEILRYLNRLSDLLFVLARAENQHSAQPEILWQRQ